jgi:hypothetical protein
MTGDYFLSVNAQTDTGTTIGYVNGQQLHLPPFHIRNPRTFTRPQITITVLGEEL